MKAGLESSVSLPGHSNDAPGLRRPTYVVPILFCVWVMVNLVSSGVAELESSHGSCCEIMPPVEQKVLSLIGGGAMDANAACNVLGIQDPSADQTHQAVQISAALVGDALDAWVGVLNKYSLWAIIYAIVAMVFGVATWRVVRYARRMTPLTKSECSRQAASEFDSVPESSESVESAIVPSPTRFPKSSTWIPAGLFAWTAVLVVLGYLIAFASNHGRCCVISPVIEERVSRLIDQGAMSEEKSRVILGIPVEGEGCCRLLRQFSEPALRSWEGAMFDMVASAWLNAATSLVFGIGSAVWLWRLQRRFKSHLQPSPT